VLVVLDIGGMDRVSEFLRRVLMTTGTTLQRYGLVVGELVLALVAILATQTRIEVDRGLPGGGIHALAWQKIDDILVDTVTFETI
jgi:hypothetical protein